MSTCKLPPKARPSLPLGAHTNALGDERTLLEMEWQPWGYWSLRWKGIADGRLSVFEGSMVEWERWQRRTCVTPAERIVFVDVAEAI